MKSRGLVLRNAKHEGGLALRSASGPQTKMPEGGLALRSASEPKAKMREGGPTLRSALRVGGFTLIELTIVLAILVVVSGFLILRVGGISSRQALHASARTLGNTIRTYRERARLEERSYILRLEGREYSVIEQGSSDPVRRGRLAAGQEFESPGSTTLALGPRGVMPETRVALRNSRGERVILAVSGVLNEVRYEEASR